MKSASVFAASSKRTQAGVAVGTVLGGLVATVAAARGADAGPA